MKLEIFILMFILVGFPAFAKEDKAPLISDKIVTPQSSKNDPALPETSYDLQKWRIKEEKVVSDAIDVFKRKAQPIRSKRVWIYDKNGEKNFLVEHTPSEKNPKVLFSDDENFAFFIGLSDIGQSIIYGINLTTGNQYPIDTASHFDMITCPNNKKSYVIVNKRDSNRNTYFIYNLNGKQESSLMDAVTPENLKDKVCY